MQPLNILIVGAGMYVCGKGTDGYGTIMPALLEWARHNNPGDVYVVAAHPQSAKKAKVKIDCLKKLMALDINVSYFPKTGNGGAAAYKDAIRSINKPAVCIVAVPDHAHKTIAENAMNAGMHTLVVKPLTPTAKEALVLIKVKEKNNVYGAVEFHKRFDEANLKMKDVISGGHIGEPLYFVVEYSQRKSVPSVAFRKWADRTNVFQYLGVHYVDIIYFATGAVPIRAMAVGQKRWLVSKGINTYDSVEAVIEWRYKRGNKFTSIIATNWIDPENTSAMSDQKIKVVGTKGRFESDQKNRGIAVVTESKGVEEPNPYFCGHFGREGAVCYKGYGIESVHQFLEDAADIEEGRVSADELKDKRPTFEQAVVSTKVVEAVNRSLNNDGKWIKIR